MKVCLLGHFPPHLGGVSSHTYLLSQELIKRGDEVYVLTYPHPDIGDMKGVHVETAPTINIRGLRGFFFFLAATWKLISMTRKYDIDLIHAHFLLPPGLVAVIAGGVTKKKIAVTIHGSDIFIQASNPVLRILIKFILKRADHVAVVSEAIREKVLDLDVVGVQDKIKVTPNAVDVQKYRPSIKTSFIQDMELNPKKPIILFVGNLVLQKGLKYLLKAKKLLKSDAQLVLVGDGPLMMVLKEMINKQNIRDVFFMGARRDVYRIMPATDVFVLPSISEGFPITLLEAFASGLPVVATSVGGIKELVSSDVGILVEPMDPTGLSEALDQIIQNDELRHEMGKSARKKALTYATLDIPY